MSGEERWCVVTGGRGFAARHLVEMLIKYEMFAVRIADLPSSIDLEPYEENGLLGKALRLGRAHYVSTDLRHKAQVVRALEGVEVVFHIAAPNSSINNYQLHHSVNVQGTKNVIEACTELKVKRLIYTSSPSVVFDGVHGIFNGNESLPYPPNHNDSYSATKAEGEALVIKSNGVNGLLTCCIRPSTIFGPGDRLFVPSLVSAARAGQSKFIIVDGNNVYDFTYFENVAHAHICAERALASGGEVAEKAAGRTFTYCFNIILIDCPIKGDLSKLRSSVLKDGIQKTIESYSHLRAENQPNREGPSKASVYLRWGRVADTLLWKNKRQTLTVLLVLVAIYCNFIASGSTIITALSKLLLVSLIFLFIHGSLPNKILGYTVEKIPASNFHLSEEKSRDVGLPFAFIAFYVYEKKEQEIEALFLEAFSMGCKLKSDIAGKLVTSKKSD
ncbi:hypothetical protein CRYUN_Cryun03dG0025200 [Craigia yunnanensis]